MDSQKGPDSPARYRVPKESNVELINDHVTKHLGKSDWAWHELISTIVHIDVHHVAPVPDERDYHILYTTGMSDRHMTVPDGEEEFRRAELMMYLPPRWPFDRLRNASRADDIEDLYWPIRWLKKLARYPHVHNTWVALGHTIPNGEPEEPSGPGTDMTGFLVLPPEGTPDGFTPLKVGPDKQIWFWLLLPIYSEEMALKLEQGLQALWDRLVDGLEDVEHLIAPTRRNVCRDYPDTTS